MHKDQNVKVIFARPVVLAIAAICIVLGPVQIALADCDAVNTDTATKSDPRLSDLGVSPYEPLYFILGGSNGFNAKFQISFKYQIFSNEGWFAECLRLPSRLFLSYSQTSLWDLDVRSSPFRDSSYRPRLFYLRENMWNSDDKSWRLNFETGLAHESNGKGVDDSRAINLGYVKPTLSYYVTDKRRFYVAPMVFAYIDKGENEQIDEYRGNVDLLIGYGSGNNGGYDWNVWANLRKGTVGRRGSVELNLATPFRFLTGGRMNGWLLTQYFSGHCESLLEYDKKLKSQLRFGFAILVQ